MEETRTEQSRAGSASLSVDTLDYKVKFYQTYTTEDGRRLSGVTLRPITVGEYGIVEECPTLYQQVKKLSAMQLGITEADLDKFDMRDFKQIMGVVAHFLPYAP